MGVAKNIWVRIGADVSACLKGFKSAITASAGAKESIKKSSAETRRSIRETFSSSVPSIKKYREEVTQTKSAHQTATQNVDRLKDKISQLTSVYDTVKSATAGLDLSKPLEELMVDAEKNLTAIESKRRKIEAELAALGSSPKAANSKRTAALQAELAQLAEKSRFAEARMADLDRIADQVGSANMGYASVKGLQQLEQQINSTKNELNTTQMVVDETGRKLKSLGVAPTIGRALKGIGAAAAQAAGAGVKKLWSGLKSLAGSAVRGLASLPGKLLGIGKSASAGCGGLSRMVRSIRNIGAVSLGLRVASGMFGRLRSVISSYISQNEELNASVTAMKNQMGAALAPAINLVLNAMQRLMPVVTAVSSAISSVFTALFGKVSATSKAISASAAAAGDAAEDLDVHGFDQITKESDESSGGGGGGGSSDAGAQIAEQSALVQKLTSWIQELKAAFNAGDWMRLGQIVGNGINSIVESIDGKGIGTKVGQFANNLFTALHSALSTIDFFNIGATVGQMLSAAFQQIDWQLVGSTVGVVMQILPNTLLGFITATDWSSVGNGIGTALTSAFASIDWGKIKQLLTEGFNGILDLITGFASGFAPLQEIDFTPLTTSLQGLWDSVWNLAAVIGESLAEAYDAVLKPIAGWVIEDAVPASVDVFTAAFDALSAILKPVIDGISGLLTAIDPVIVFIEDVAIMCLNALKDTFEKVGKVFTEKGSKVQNIITGIGEIINQLWLRAKPPMMYLKELFGAVLGYINDAVSNTIGWLIDLFSGLIDFVVGIFTGDWGRAWDGIVGIFNGVIDSIKNNVNAVIGFINGLISGVCSGINTIIRAMNRLKWDIPDWVPLLGGKTFGFNLKEITAPKIPMLAKGAVVNEPTAAIIGEAGKEAVMPLENNTGWITKLAQQINQQGGGGTQSLALAIYFRSRKLAEYVVQDINQITRETGVCPIYV